MATIRHVWKNTSGITLATLYGGYGETYKAQLVINSAFCAVVTCGHKTNASSRLDSINGSPGSYNSLHLFKYGSTALVAILGGTFYGGIYYSCPNILIRGSLFVNQNQAQMAGVSNKRHIFRDTNNDYLMIITSEGHLYVAGSLISDGLWVIDLTNYTTTDCYNG